jgi:hypothetical protein
MADEPKMLTVVLSRAGLLLGKRVDNKLLKPRLITTFEEKRINPITMKEEFDPQIRMQPFPGLPAEYLIGANEGSYKMPIRRDTKEIYELYERVTNPSVDPG